MLKSAVYACRFYGPCAKNKSQHQALQQVRTIRIDQDSDQD